MKMEERPYIPQATYEVPVVWVVRRQKPRYWLPLLLLALTLFTTMVVGARLQHNFTHNLAAFSTSEYSLPMFPLRWLAERPERFFNGIPFSVAVMLILGAHELGHYFYCRRYRVDATLPHFIPAPTLIGTMGAFIRIKSAFPSRAALFDIGVAGPIAGFVVALPITVLGLAMSKPLSTPPEASISLGYPLLFHGIHRIFMSAGLHPQQPMSYVLLHPLAIAGWVGMFATSLNLLPGGQLDGGHIVYAWSERAHKIVTYLSMLAMVPLAWFGWSGWLIWGIVLALTGLRHPVIYDDAPLRGRRAWLLLAAAAILIVSIMPTPLGASGIRDAIEELRQVL